MGCGGDGSEEPNICSEERRHRTEITIKHQKGSFVWVEMDSFSGFRKKDRSGQSRDLKGRDWGEDFFFLLQGTALWWGD